MAFVNADLVVSAPDPKALYDMSGVAGSPEIYHPPLWRVPAAAAMKLTVGCPLKCTYC